MRLFSFAAVGIFFAVAAAARADYTVTDLTPAGTPTAEALANANGVQGGAVDVGGGTLHAYLWNGSAPGTDLHSAATGNPDSSAIYAVTPTQAAGYVSDSGVQHAALWTPGGGTVFQRLPDAAYSSSQAVGIAGTVIVGSGAAAGANTHALLWTDPTQNPIDLQPPSGYLQSAASGTDGTRIAGTATTMAGNDHAALWNVSTQAFSDIHPLTGYTSSNALSVSGNLVAGYALQDDRAVSPSTHAMLWTISGVDESITSTDLNPAGFDASYASCTNGVFEVGFGTEGDGNDHALLWQGTNAALDLSVFLPAGEYVSSEATGVDVQNDVVGIATDTSGNTHAILWTFSAAVPEPASAALLAMPGLLLLLRRRRRV